MIVPNSKYKFSFIDILSMLNGTYEILNITSYDYFIETGGDIYKDLFEPNNIDVSEYNLLLEDIEKDDILFLNNLETITPVIAVSKRFLLNYPISHIKPYPYLVLSVKLGCYDNGTIINSIKTTIQDILSYQYGIDTSNNNVIIQSIDNKYLTDQEYEIIVTDRETRKIETINYYSETKRLQQELNNAYALIQQYENTLKNL